MLIDKIGLPATLELLAEECTELAQASLKMARVLRGENPTPVTEAEALDGITEEMADVQIVMEDVYRIGPVSQKAVVYTKAAKLERLDKRLKRGMKP